MNKDGRPRPTRSAEAPRPALAIIPVARVKIPFGQGQPRIRLALVDNDPRMHEFVQEAFGAFSAGWVLESYATTEQALRQISRKPPPVVLMGTCLGAISVTECVWRLMSVLPDLRVIMLAVHVDIETFLESLDAGACGMLMRTTEAEQLVRSIQGALQGYPAMCPEAVRVLVNCFLAGRKQRAAALLTVREREVVACLLAGKTDKEIVEKL